MTVELSQRENARQKAETDWNNQCASFLCYGDFYSNRPVIHSCGLYLAVSWEHESFIRSYNKAILRLIDLHGLPDWAPGKRIVSRGKIPALLAKAEPLDRYVARSKKERTLVRRGIRVWKDQYRTGPTAFCRLDERSIIVLAGKVGEFVRVDLIDTLRNRWMCTYELDSSDVSVLSTVPTED